MTMRIKLFLSFLLIILVAVAGVAWIVQQGAARGVGAGAGIYAGPREAFAGLSAVKSVDPDPRLAGAYAWHEELGLSFALWTLVFSIPFVLLCCGLGMIGSHDAPAEAEHLLVHGFEAIKVRLGYVEARTDVEVVWAVRRAIGERVALRFFKKVRDQEAFSGAEELAAQIGRDVEAVRAYLLQAR